jgi:hypothetical protein
MNSGFCGTILHVSRLDPLCSYLGRAGQTPPQPNQQLIDDVFTQYLHQPIEIQPIEKLTLFDYIQLFKNLWNQYQEAFNDLEWDAIEKVLSEVRHTRNAIAHFREVTPNQRKHLKFCSNLLDRHRSILEEETSGMATIRAKRYHDRLTPYIYQHFQKSAFQRG